MKAWTLPKKRAKKKTMTNSSALRSHPRSCAKLLLLRNQKLLSLTKMIMKLMIEPLQKKRARFKSSRLHKMRTVAKKMIFSEVDFPANFCVYLSVDCMYNQNDR